jgi:flavodoxin
MKALIIYDSVFGNTEQVAQAMGEALRAQGNADVLRVGDAKPEQLAGLDLLIVGSPTRAFTATPAIKQFLGSIPSGGLAGLKVAAFDTRVSVDDTGSRILRFLVGIFGYAAKPIANRLEKKGGNLAAPPEGFIVGGTEGPLKEGELARAANWAQGLNG